MVNYIKYKAIDRFEIEFPWENSRIFHILPNQEIYIDLEDPFYGYWETLGGVWHFTLDQDQFDQISQYIEKVKDLPVENHEGMVQGYDGQWRWF